MRGATTLPAPRGVLLPFALLAVAALAACQGAPRPFEGPTEAYRGLKARTFEAEPGATWRAVVASLEALGYEIRIAGTDRGFVVARSPMELGVDDRFPERRAWTRVEVALRLVEEFGRAPRTLVEVDATRVQGTVDGPIEAGRATVPSSFYEELFADVGARLAAAARD